MVWYFEEVVWYSEGGGSTVTITGLGFQLRDAPYLQCQFGPNALFASNWLNTTAVICLVDSALPGRYVFM